MSDAHEAILGALRSVYDPCCQEMGISVVDMGVVRSVRLEGRAAHVELILTSGWCPFGADLVSMVRERIEALPDIDAASVEVTWDEAWSPERLSPEAQRKLRFLPRPRTAAAREALRRRYPATIASEERTEP